MEQGILNLDLPVDIFTFLIVWMSSFVPSQSPPLERKRGVFSWFLPLWRTWGRVELEQVLLREVVVTIFEHHLGLGVRIALGEKSCFGKKEKVFPGINSNSCCYCYLVFVFLLASDGPALVNSSQSHFILGCGEALWFMAHNCPTEQFIRLLNPLSPYFRLTQSIVFPYCHLEDILPAQSCSFFCNPPVLQNTLFFTASFGWEFHDSTEKLYLQKKNPFFKNKRFERDKPYFRSPSFRL